MVSLLDSVAQEGVSSLDNFPLAINLISNLAYDNCKKLNALFKELRILTKTKAVMLHDRKKRLINKIIEKFKRLEEISMKKTTSEKCIE